MCGLERVRERRLLKTARNAVMGATPRPVSLEHPRRSLSRIHAFAVVLRSKLPRRYEVCRPFASSFSFRLRARLELGEGNRLELWIVAGLWRFIIIFGCEKRPEEAANANTVAVPGTHAGKGIGPVSDVELGPLAPALAAKGKSVFDQKCAACHKFDERFVAPPLKGVTQRRQPEWILSMILNPVEMTQKDPAAKELLGTYLTQMTFQDVSGEDARAILEYFHQVDGSS